MSSLSTETLRPLHPFFSQFLEKVHCFEPILKINSQGHKSERYIVVTSPAIFILNQRSFPRVFQVRKIIPIIELKSILLTETNMTINGIKSFTFKHPQHLKIAAKIYSIRNAIADSFPFSVEIDPLYRKTFDQVFYDFKNESPLGDLFLSFALQNGCSTSEENIKIIYHRFSKVSTVATLDSEFSSFDPLLLSLSCLAISYYSKLNELIISNLEISTILPQLAHILQVTPSITQISFQNVTFAAPQKDYQILFKENPLNSIITLTLPTIVNGPKYPVSHFFFFSSDFSNSHCQYFFESFQSYQGKITMLCCEKCIFTPETLDSLFQSIFFSSSFHSLETLLLSNIQFPDILVGLLLQLACCGWVLETRCLKSLSIQDCNINSSYLLSQFLQLDIGLVNLELTGSNFEKPFEVSQMRLNSLSYLSLRSSKISSESIKSLFNALRSGEQLKKDRPLMTLDFSSAQFSLASLPLISVKSLYGIHFDDIKITRSQCQHLMDFLVIQPALEDLSISGCFTKADFGECASDMFPLFAGKPLDRFSIAAISGEELGSSLMNVLNPVTSSSSLRYLNIHGQNIGGKNLKNILTSCQVLEAIDFEGFSPSDGKEIIEIIQNIIRKNSIQSCVWPALDIKNILSRETSSQKVEFQKLLSPVRAQFEARFGKINDNNIDNNNLSNMEESSALSTIAKFQTILMTKTNGNTPNQGNSHQTAKVQKTNSDENDIEKKSYGFKVDDLYDEQTRMLLSECDGELVDPLESLFREIEKQMSVCSLSNLLKNN